MYTYRIQLRKLLLFVSLPSVSCFVRAGVSRIEGSRPEVGTRRECGGARVHFDVNTTPIQHEQNGPGLFPPFLFLFRTAFLLYVAERSQSPSRAVDRTNAKASILLLLICTGKLAYSKHFVHNKTRVVEGGGTSKRGQAVILGWLIEKELCRTARTRVAEKTPSICTAVFRAKNPANYVHPQPSSETPSYRATCRNAVLRTAEQ